MSGPWLLIVDGDSDEPVVHELDLLSVTLGSAEGNDVVLSHATVDERHARIVIKDNKFILVDLRSRTGTFVGERAMTSPQVIAEGQRFRVGPFHLSMEAIVVPDLRDDDVVADAELELLEMIAAAPGDDGPRMVYADELMDRGDPRGEFIALQCELARTPEPAAQDVERRLRALLARAPGSPLSRLIQSGLPFHRGFLTAAMCMTRYRRLRAGPALHRLSPAVYEIAEITDHYASMWVHQGKRFTPAGDAGDVVIMRWGTPFLSAYGDEATRRGDMFAENQAALRGRLEDLVAPALEVIRYDKPGQLGLAMKWPVGLRFSELVARVDETAAPISPAFATSVVIELCRSIAPINDAGVSFWALDPRHLVISPGGEVIVADLTWSDAAPEMVPHPTAMPRSDGGGNMIARGDRLFRYAAPEAFSYDPTSPASDVFAASALLSHVLEAPVGLGRNAPRSDVPGALSLICDRGTKRSPLGRFAHVSELREALGDVAAQNGWSTGPGAVAEVLEATWA